MYSIFAFLLYIQFFSLTQGKEVFCNIGLKDQIVLETKSVSPGKCFFNKNPNLKETVIHYFTDEGTHNNIVIQKNTAISLYPTDRTIVPDIYTGPNIDIDMLGQPSASVYRTNTEYFPPIRERSFILCSQYHCVESAAQQNILIRPISPGSECPIKQRFLIPQFTLGDTIIYHFCLTPTNQAVASANDAIILWRDTHVLNIVHLGFNMVKYMGIAKINNNHMEYKPSEFKDPTVFGSRINVGGIHLYEANFTPHYNMRQINAAVKLGISTCHTHFLDSEGSILIRTPITTYAYKDNVGSSSFSVVQCSDVYDHVSLVHLINTPAFPSILPRSVFYAQYPTSFSHKLDAIYPYTRYAVLRDLLTFEKELLFNPGAIPKTHSPIIYDWNTFKRNENPGIAVPNTNLIIGKIRSIDYKGQPTLFSVETENEDGNKIDLKLMVEAITHNEKYLAESHKNYKEHLKNQIAIAKKYYTLHSIASNQGFPPSQEIIAQNLKTIKDHQKQSNALEERPVRQRGSGYANNAAKKPLPTDMLKVGKSLHSALESTVNGLFEPQQSSENTQDQQSQTVLNSSQRETVQLDTGTEQNNKKDKRASRTNSTGQSQPIFKHSQPAADKNKETSDQNQQPSYGTSRDKEEGEASLLTRLKLIPSDTWIKVFIVVLVLIVLIVFVCLRVKKKTEKKNNKPLMDQEDSELLHNQAQLL